MAKHLPSSQEAGDQFPSRKCGEPDLCTSLNTLATISTTVTQMTHPFTRTTPIPEYKSTAQLVTDAYKLVSLLPPDINHVIGIARSGLTVASIVAMSLHLPMSIMRQSDGDIIPAGNGWRLKGHQHHDGRAVVIDDTVMAGRSLRDCMPIVWKQFPNAISATVYCSPLSRYKPNYYVSEWAYPQLGEWNMPNSIYTQDTAVDFDGILCNDCDRDADDDGPKYLDFLANTKPKYLTRRAPIPLIVTGRLEKYRPQTEAWLAKWNIRWCQLEMYPGDYRTRTARSVAEFKAEHFAEFLKRDRIVKPPFFVESDPTQANIIAKKTGGFVVCPAVSRCFFYGVKDEGTCT